MERLKRRSDFRAAAAATRAPCKAFVLQARRRADEKEDIRVGFTVSRRVGNAVERNRVRRRLRELLRLASVEDLRAGYDYVMIGRRAALDLPFGDMMRELDAALQRIHAVERERTGGAAKGSLHEAGSQAPSRPRSPPRPRRNPSMQGR